jgi:hypothetical protein
MYPVLDDVVHADDVATKGTGKFAASYVNWSKIAMYLRKHAPGWQPFAEPNANGSMEHSAPDGSFYLLIGFVHREHGRTELVPHAVMDHTMKAMKNPGSRDLSDAFVRGMCKAAALLFGLGWRLWSKDDPFERDEDHAPPKVQAKQAAPPPKKRTFETPEQAAIALGKCQSDKHVDAWLSITNASGFAFEELKSLNEAASEHRARLAEEA